MSLIQLIAKRVLYELFTCFELFFQEKVKYNNKAVLKGMYYKRQVARSHPIIIFGIPISIGLVHKPEIQTQIQSLSVKKINFIINTNIE